MTFYNDPNSVFNTSMISNATDSTTINSNTPTYTFTTNGTGGGGSISSGLYWGLNGTSAPNTVLTSNGTGGTIWSDPNLNGATLSVKGDADFEGEVKIKGKSLTDMFEKIEDRLAILHPNPELEEKWEELRNLRKTYMELEQEIIEKEKVWKILKD